MIKMKRALAVGLLMLSWPLSAIAAPYLVSDPSTEAEVESCIIDGLGPASSGGICDLSPERAIRVDLAYLAAGTYTVRAKFCVQKGLWCSDWSTPFVFTKPALGAPSKIGLSVR